MQRFITNETLKVIQKNIPVKKTWESKFHRGKEIIADWLARKPNKKDIRNTRYEGLGSVGGIIGIKYEQVSSIVPRDQDNDWKKLIQANSNGITKTGQLLLQKAAEAYVYCVLGAQAQTRWRIVGSGAKSMQTQEIFEKLVKDLTVQDDDTVNITNMRTAIKATNVVLDTAISPGLILIPSNMQFLKDKIPGDKGYEIWALRWFKLRCFKVYPSEASAILADAYATGSAADATGSAVDATGSAT